MTWNGKATSVRARDATEESRRSDGSDGQGLGEEMSGAEAPLVNRPAVSEVVPGSTRTSVTWSYLLVIGLRMLTEWLRRVVARTFRGRCDSPGDREAACN